MTLKKLLGLALLLPAASSFAADDAEMWGKIQYAYNLIGEANTNIQKLFDEVAQLKANQTRHYVGESYHGGIVFWVDESKQHGLIASKIDVTDEGIQWRNGASGNKITNARGDGIGSGETNTRLIIASQTIDNQKGRFAALMASQFQVQADGITPCKTPIANQSVCYGGWYLPSAFELQLMHTNLQKGNRASFVPDFYWTSTEATASNAWLINFSTGELSASDKASTMGRVRAVARF
ncbi:TPA: DUF1566 domain-containing protein [Legionella pneumophila]|uniref:DUF1566 domain-containing protein n=1 Tax=Legionella pneumophila TaxID=446 RepID=UPI001374F74B|nr:DUF1566 domain-containing protein [Legionella pneumophila]HAT9326900.1 DUF1566 domain-containing protein [Legionella pneumophila subsp. pneumophila]MCK1858712.1 DUF1566 domain-containing protein [Legionella pneumophila]HAT1811100.1 DUF1566 domain-containing protein [Legionella pneumophila]HAT2028499.1 DUF1566 domain-containing protein [Legionella pneumophila]HAT8308162.1 DUF1566 domain-containing protein [Legionella pneumophila]